MLKFLANIIEQIDLALEHVSKGDVNNARFGLMLIDNAVEITLHQTAKDIRGERSSFLYRDKPYEHAAALDAALGQHFESKVKFVRKTGKLGAAESDSILILHAFRNEVYHIGVQYEAVLPSLSKLYFLLACDFLRSYEPKWISYSPGMKLPERAAKYFGNQKFFMRGIEQYHAACDALGKSVTVAPAEFAETLADHMDDVIEQQDTAVDMIATGGPHTYSRDEAIEQTFAWKIAFTDEAKEFARDKGWRKGSVFDFVNWIAANYPLPIRHDPIQGWRARASSLRRETNPHKALKKYRDFMTQTADVRAALDEAHGQVDQYIQEQIDRMRGK